jgi:hypothetical protein
MKKILISAMVMGVMSFVAVPEAKAEYSGHYSNNSEVNAWQQCGIGAMVFPNNGTAAAISNIIWDLGTTAVTTKVSSVESCAGNSARTAMFINSTFSNLEEEVAEGEGDYLNAMLELRGCNAESNDKIISDVRGEFSTAPSESAEDFYNLVEKTVSSQPAGVCTSA